MHHLPKKQEASHLIRPEHRFHFKNKVCVDVDMCAGERICHTFKYGKVAAIIYFPFYYLCLQSSLLVTIIIFNIMSIYYYKYHQLSLSEFS